MPQQFQAPPGTVFVQPQASTTAVPIAITSIALQNTGSATLAGCNTALVTTIAAHGYTETRQANGVLLIANATTGHGPPAFGVVRSRGSILTFRSPVPRSTRR